MLRLVYNMAKEATSVDLFLPSDRGNYIGYTRQEKGGRCHWRGSIYPNSLYSSGMPTYRHLCWAVQIWSLAQLATSSVAYTDQRTSSQRNDTATSLLIGSCAWAEGLFLPRCKAEERSCQDPGETKSSITTSKKSSNLVYMCTSLVDRYHIIHHF